MMGGIVLPGLVQLHSRDIHDSGKPFLLKYLIYVPGLKNNLVSVAMLEDRGYDVVFSEGKSFLHHKATGHVKKIRFV